MAASSASTAPPPPTVLDIPITCRVVTARTAHSMVSAVLELLLFQRHQIPLVYPSFKFMVEKFRDRLERDGHDESGAWDEFLLDEERRVALRTLQSIKAVQLHIAQQIEQLDIDRVMILFGSNPLIARESFEIVLPHINRQHAGANHRQEDVAVVRQLNMNILTGYQPQEHLASSLTKVYVLFHQRTSVAASGIQRWPASSPAQCVLHERYEPHPDCVRHRFRLVNRVQLGATLNCCADLRVFKDMADLHIATRPDDGAMAEGEVDIDAADELLDDTWYESEFSVTGYKEVNVKGRPIWM